MATESEPAQPAETTIKAAAHVAGELAKCPVCGREVLQKTMIPVLAEAGPPGHAYVCVECARARIDTSQVTTPQGVTAASDEPDEATGA